MLGKTLVTIQTGPAGKQVQRLYITDGVDIAKEFYLALLVDRESGRIAVVASTEGGMEIEKVAHETPEKIATITIDPATGLMPHHGREVSAALGLSGDLAKQAARCWPSFTTLSSAPTPRRSRSIRWRSPTRASCWCSTPRSASTTMPTSATQTSNSCATLPKRTRWRSRRRSTTSAYIKLDGSIGCMVNGAGLAMATMDIIKLEGGEPANFLDVGGGANKEKVTAAFKIILSDPAVKGILVNIFGGIMRCDIIAEGIVAAAREVSLSVPLVVRLEGTNVQQGKDILASSGLPIIPANDLGDAARKIVAEVKGAGRRAPRRFGEHTQ